MLNLLFNPFFNHSLNENPESIIRNIAVTSTCFTFTTSSHADVYLYLHMSIAIVICIKPDTDKWSSLFLLQLPLSLLWGWEKHLRAYSHIPPVSQQIQETATILRVWSAFSASLFLFISSFMLWKRKPFNAAVSNGNKNSVPFYDVYIHLLWAKRRDHARKAIPSLLHQPHSSTAKGLGFGTKE